MLMRIRAIITLSALVLGTMAMAEAYTIPPEKVDGQKIYWGTAANFERPGEVSYEAVVKATPEYAEIKKKKVERGTAKYWILMSQASDHAVQLIAEVGKESDYDLISAQGYLAKLDPPVPAEDITQLVLAKLDDDGKGKR